MSTNRNVKKQIAVYIHTAILKNKEKSDTTWINFKIVKKPDKRVHTILFHLHVIQIQAKVTSNDRNQAVCREMKYGIGNK